MERIVEEMVWKLMTQCQDADRAWNGVKCALNLYQDQQNYGELRYFT